MGVQSGFRIAQMPITDESKIKVMHRLTKAMGHLNHVYKMVDEKRYCIDVLNQMKAVQAALDKISEEILKQHLETCVVEAVQAQDSQRIMDELIQVFRKAPELDLEMIGRSGAATSEEAENSAACCR